MHKLIYRPIVVISLVMGLMLVIEVIALGGITWRNLQRIDTIKQDIKHGHQLEQLVFELLDHSKPASSTPEQALQIHSNLHRQIISFLENQYSDTQSTRQSLIEIQKLLVSVEQGRQQDPAKALRLSRQVLLQHIQEEETLLDEVYADSQLELKLAIIIPSSILLIFLLFGHFLLDRHVISPINALEVLLSNLIKGEKRPIEKIKVDSVMQPLFENYNRLVTRLTELEQEHLNHTHSLEREVRNATHTLLEQSHILSRSERLAAVGELAASAAHELRNPLAGIQVAMENMQNDCSDDDMRDRLQMVNAEIKRLTGRLNDLLAYSRQTPEKAQHLKIYPLVDNLITLLRYQIKENISLKFQVDEKISVFLPECELRQALLNLLLNAIQSIGSRGGTVNLKAYPHQHMLVFEISDDGTGFPSSLLKQGIRPFASYKDQGTGLGLPMVQRFAKSHGGSLELRNNQQGHACATLKLKL